MSATSGLSASAAASAGDLHQYGSGAAVHDGGTMAPAPAGATVDERLSAVEAAIPAPGAIADILSRLSDLEKTVAPQIEAAVTIARTDIEAFAPIMRDLTALSARARSQGHSIGSILGAVAQQLLGIKV